ncbi:MAG: serine protease [Gemmataceae bacterium]|nr:serine protease [Gemmataceae bacterium]
MSVFLLTLAAVGSPPWLEDANFPRARQESALSTTMRLTNSKGGEGTAVRVGKIGDVVYYLTAEHVIDGCQTVDLDAYTPKSWPIPSANLRGARVIDRWAQVDLALIRLVEPEAGEIAKFPPKTATLAAKDTPVMSVGCGGGTRPTFAIDRGTRLRVHRPGSSEGFIKWQTGSIPVPGRSGGPLFDTNGYLVGICSGTDGKNGYYTHWDEIKPCLQKSVIAKLVE